MDRGKTSTVGIRRSLFWRLWLRSLTVRRPQAALAVASLLVGAAVASMLLNLYGDVRRKMTREFRAYGANVILAPRVAPSSLGPNHATVSDSVTPLLGEDSLSRLEAFRRRKAGLVAVPVLHVVVRLKRIPADPRLAESQNVVAAGVDFEALRQLAPGWRVEAGLPANATVQKGCVIGSHVASRMVLRPGNAIELAPSKAGSEPGGPREVLTVEAVVSTGSSEDDQVFLPLESLQSLAGLSKKASLVEMSVPGETAEIEQFVGELAQAFPDAEVRPVRQIVYSEGKVLATIRWLAFSLTALILLIIAHCVMATMLAIFLERRKDIAVMKALGASDRVVVQLFVTEGASFGLAGGLAGFFAGVYLARELGWRLFGVALGVAWWSFPLVALMSTLLAAVATFLQVNAVRAVQPAVVLKGE